MRKTIMEIQNSVPRTMYSIDCPMLSIEKHLEQFNVNLDPKYQRDYVWTTEQQEKFVGALIEYPRSIPNFVFNFTTIGSNYLSGNSEIVDGKQRINSCLKWKRGEISALCPCGDKVEFNSLNEVEERILGIATTMKWIFINLPPVDVMKYYIRLNSGGTVHSNEELDRVRKLIRE